MLVLTRKAGEGIVIGDDVIVSVIEIKGGGIRIGVDAPPEKKIYRQEVYERICRENKEAVKWNIADLNALNLTTGGKKRKP